MSTPAPIYTLVLPVFIYYTSDAVDRLYGGVCMSVSVLRNSEMDYVSSLELPVANDLNTRCVDWRQKFELQGYVVSQ